MATETIIMYEAGIRKWGGYGSSGMYEWGQYAAPRRVPHSTPHAAVMAAWDDFTARLLTELGNGDIPAGLPLRYLSDGIWEVTLSAIKTVSRGNHD